MTAGLQVFNDSNTVQIDDTYANLRLIRKGTVPAGKTGVTVTGVFPVCVLRLDQPVGGGVDIYSYVESCINVGNSWTFTIGTTLGGVAKPGTAIEYYIFDRADPTPSNFGLQTFDGSGKLIFDSNEKYLKILSSIHTPNYRTLGTIATPPGKKVGVIMGRMPGWLRAYFVPGGAAGVYFIQYYTAGMRNVSNGINISETWFFSRASVGGGPAQDYGFPEFTCLVVDLTGM